MYGGSGLSPAYHPQGGTSPQPQYIFPVENLPGRTPSPLDAPNYAFTPSNFPNITPPPMNIQPAQQQQQQQATASMVVGGTSLLTTGGGGNIQMSHMSVGLSNYMLAQQNWNVANVADDQTAGSFHTAAEASNAMNVGDSAGAGLSSVLDLDSQELTQLDSAELAGLNLFDANLSENLSNNLSLSDIKTDTHHVKEDVAQENMTDSFTRLTTATIDNICNLNNMYKPNIKEWTHTYVIYLKNKKKTYK